MTILRCIPLGVVLTARMAIVAPFCPDLAGVVIPNTIILSASEIKAGTFP